MINESNISIFLDLLRIKFDNSTASARSIYHESKDENVKRAIAVSCALELIKSEITGCEISNLEYLLDKLPHFTDIIQKSLDVKDDKS